MSQGLIYDFFPGDSWALAVVFCLAVLLSGCGSSSSPQAAPLQITTKSPLPPGRVDTSYTTTLNATGGYPPYSWSASGTVPPGLSLNSAGILSGTPSTAGVFVINVAVTDQTAPSGMSNAGLSITIVPQLQITTTSLPNGSPSVFYSVTLAATGGTAPYSWTITQGSLPNGLTLTATTGVISGTPIDVGTSSFTVQVSDSENPAATATAGLSIVISPPPPRNAALYLSNGTGLQIQSDGSLSPLPSSPEAVISGFPLGSSPTSPILFEVGGPENTLVFTSILVNPDYSLTPISSASIPTGTGGIPYGYGPPTVDPTGANVYLPGLIGTSGTLGVTIYPSNGPLQSVGTVTIPNVTFMSRTVFTPDGALAFIQTCPADSNGSILSYSRSSNGMLTPGPVYMLPTGSCAQVLTVSPDGRYLAAVLPATPLGNYLVQVYSIASDGTLTAVLPQPFTVLVTPSGSPVTVNDMTWDQSGSFLLLATGTNFMGPGGTAVLSFSGSAITEIVYPTGISVLYLQQAGSLVYAMGACVGIPGCDLSLGVAGFDFQNGQLTPLPGSPYPYGPASYIVVY